MVRLLITTALLSSAALSAAAQALSVVVAGAGAGGRYETKLDLKQAVPGFAAAKVAAFRGRVDRLVGQLAAMPSVNAPPAPVCHRLESWIEIVPRHGVLAAEVRAMQPIAFERGRCHTMTRAGVHVGLNRLSDLLDEQRASVREDDRVFWALPIEIATRQVIDLGDRVAFTHGRAPLLVPVSAERYLRTRIAALPEGPSGGASGEFARWLAGGKAAMLAENAARLKEMSAYLKPADMKRMAEAQQVVVDSTEKELRRAASVPSKPTERERAEAALTALGPAERAAPACLSRDSGRLDPSPGCTRGETLVELNPAYFDKRRPEAAQLIVAHTPAGPTHGEDATAFAARQAVWAALDRTALAALVD